MKRNRLAAVLIGAALAVPLWAQNDTDSNGPGRGIARISVINGEVSVRRGDTADVVAAAINAPLAVEDRLLTGEGSRAEVQFDYANMIRMGGMSEIRLSELEAQRYQVQIARGTVTFRVLRDSNANVELSTPNISIRPVKRGSYRVTVREDGTTEVTVRSGEAEIFTPQGSEILKSGRTMVARGAQSDPEFQVASAGPSDDWDQWNERRDKDLERSRSYQYVSRDISGADDLDDYGSWVNEDSYGWVWSPRVAAGWAPYRDGRWVWEDWYGWTWVSYDPWGWAPYHYGRWFNSPNHGWCWWGGGLGRRHYWSPALVGWFGWNNHSGFNAGLGFGYGGIGWVPLAPYEPMHRWWGRGYYGGSRGQYGNNTTILNNVNVTNYYRNARVQNGITGVNGSDFQRGGGRYGRVDNSMVQNAGVVRGQLPVAPTRENLRMADRAARPGTMPQTRADSRFYSRRTPAQVERVPFEQQRRNVEQIARGAGPQSSRTSAPAVQQTSPAGRTANQPAAGAARTPQSGQRTDSQNGWRRFGEPAVRESAPAGRTASQAAAEAVRTPQSGQRTTDSQNGWRRFGEPQAGRAGQPPAAQAPQRQTDRGGSNASPQGNWNRYENNRPSPSVAPQQSAPRYQAPSRSEPIRMSPPIVQQRSAPAPRMESRPSYSAPSRTSSAPAPQRQSAPAARGGSSGGGGRGGSRSGGRSR